MTPDSIKSLLERVAHGDIAVDKAVEELRHLPFRDLGFARVDHHRELRGGTPEVVYGEGKTADQVASIVETLIDSGQRALVTRLEPEAAEVVMKRMPSVDFIHSEIADPVKIGRAAVVSAGTSDQSVAEEAAETLRYLEAEVIRLEDVGVAGIHRLLASKERLDEASVVIVVAGMEGALPSVIGGLVRMPVIAVPTSVGYGASFGGLAALLGMLNSCASGVTVVNIDNGFGAAMAAGLILRSERRP
jgi:NCAIR mutase (PurE)-related protein